MKSILLPSILAASTALSAQGFGIRLGANATKPNEVQGLKFSQKTSFVGGIFWEFRGGISLDFNASAKQGFESKVDGEATGEKLTWSYRSAGISWSPAFGHHRPVIGVEARRETTEAPAYGDTVSDVRTRTWAKVGYEYTHELSDPASPVVGFGIVASFTSGESFDAGKAYSAIESLRILAPKSEVTAFVSVRF